MIDIVSEKGYLESKLPSRTIVHNQLAQDIYHFLSIPGKQELVPEKQKLVLSNLQNFGSEMSISCNIIYLIHLVLAKFPVLYTFSLQIAQYFSVETIASCTNSMGISGLSKKHDLQKCNVEFRCALKTNLATVRWHFKDILHSVNMSWTPERLNISCAGNR